MPAGTRSAGGVPSSPLVSSQSFGAEGQRKEAVVVSLVRRASCIDLVDRRAQFAELGTAVPGAAEREQGLEIKVRQSEQVL